MTLTQLKSIRAVCDEGQEKYRRGKVSNTRTMHMEYINDRNVLEVFLLAAIVLMRQVGWDRVV